LFAIGGLGGFEVPGASLYCRASRAAASTEEIAMKNRSVAAWSLIAGTAAMLGTMAVHPTGHDFAGGPERISHAA
jgi:hypothetical protein